MFDDNSPGPPGSRYLRPVRPAKPVWVNLAIVYPFTSSGKRFDGGMDLQAVVEGTLKMWDRAVTGQWVAWVVFSIGRAPASQWVPADAVKPRTP